jgi:O-methyltransferase
MPNLKKLKHFIAMRLAAMGYKVVNVSRIPEDMDKEFHRVCELCRPYTCTSIERMYAMYQATRYIVEADVQGAIVECGVWRGGSAMIAALALKELGINNRKLYLYDTFAGMVEPTEKDTGLDGSPARPMWTRSQKTSHNDWCYAPLDEVSRNLASTQYPSNHCVFVRGKVEDTIPATMPDQIALLRLDTDWYSSTYHELLHLFPRLSSRGVLIIDDYGDWQGARDAVDQYISAHSIKLILHRVDHTGRIGIKA